MFTFNETHVQFVSAVAKALDLPHYTQQALHNMQDKGVMWDVLAVAGLRTVRHAVLPIDDDEAFLAAVEHVCFPSIVKPLNGYHSLGVRRITRAEDALLVFHACKREVDADDDPVWLQGHDKIVEEYIDGAEFVTETLMVDEVLFAGVIEHTCLQPPRFELRGYVSSDALPARVHEDLCCYIQDCSRALGYRNGLFDVEWHSARDGPVLQEVNPRMGAGPLWGLVYHSYGLDLIESQACLALGLPYRRVTHADLRAHVIAFYLQTPVSGTVEDVSALRQIGAGDKRVARKSVYQKEGDRVMGVADAWCVG